MIEESSNIKVAIRLRPLNERESSMGDYECVSTFNEAPNTLIVD
jgi:hypothetical protein